ncbi:unnamed protein product, partial [Pelagomonas calceolata]
VAPRREGPVARARASSKLRAAAERWPHAIAAPHVGRAAPPSCVEARRGRGRRSASRRSSRSGTGVVETSRRRGEVASRHRRAARRTRGASEFAPPRRGGLTPSPRRTSDARRLRAASRPVAAVAVAPRREGPVARARASPRLRDPAEPWGHASTHRTSATAALRVLLTHPRRIVSVQMASKSKNKPPTSL